VRSAALIVNVGGPNDADQGDELDRACTCGRLDA
jgi:hypothetical protein